jgi:hypothetical protein
LAQAYALDDDVIGKPKTLKQCVSDCPDQLRNGKKARLRPIRSQIQELRPHPAMT